MGCLRDSTNLKIHIDFCEKKIKHTIDNLAFDLLQDVCQDGFEVHKHMSVIKHAKYFTARVNLTIKSRGKDGDMDSEDLIDSELVDQKR